MYTVYVVIVKTEMNDQNESVLLDYGLWKETGESEESVLVSITEKFNKLNLGFRYQFKIWGSPSIMPDNPESMPF